MEAYVGSILLLPLVGALVMPWVSKLGRRAADALAGAVGLAVLASCLALVPHAGTPATLQVLGTNFAVDGLSLLFLVVISVVGFF